MKLPAQRYIVKWRSPHMKVPAFWGYSDKRTATRDAIHLLKNGREVLLVKVPK